MRSKISSRKRKTIILVSLIVLIIIVVAVVLKMNSLTRNVLNNDRIAANVSCTGSEILSPEQTEQIKNSGKYKDIAIEKTVSDLLKSQDGGICALELEFKIKNFEEREIINPSMNLVPDEKAMGKVYFCSPLKLVSKEEGVEIYRQTVLADEVDIDNSFFESELPADFTGPFKYELSYEMKGQYGRKMMVFSTSKRQ